MTRADAARKRASDLIDALKSSANIAEAAGKTGMSSAAMRALLGRLGLAEPSSFLGLAQNDVMPEIPVEWEESPPANDTATGLESVVFCPDAHHPYVDERAWSLFLACLRFIRPHRLVVLGDFGDFYCTSRHPKDPRRNADLSWEVGRCNAALDELDAIGIEKRHFILGNHEDNLRRHLQEHAPALFNVVKVEDLFRLSERGWTWSPYGELHRIGKVYVTHDQDFAGNKAHEQTRDAVGHNAIIGHTHHMAVGYRRNIVGESHVGAMFGWLGSAEAAEYMKRSKKRNWQHGFGLGYLRPSGVMHLQAIPFIDGEAVINGHVVTA